MGEWIACKDGFIVADVIRWKEAVWDRSSRKKDAKPKKIGERAVVAEVKREDIAEGWVWLAVLDCATRASGKKPVETYRAGVEVKRKRATIEREGFERLPWSDESARAILVVERQAAEAAKPAG